MPQTLAELLRWQASQLDIIDAEAKKGTNEMRRKIPEGRGLPPLFRAQLGWKIELVAAQWYMNNLPGSPTLSTLRSALAELLSKTRLSERDVRELEEKLWMLSHSLKYFGKVMKTREIRKS